MTAPLATWSGWSRAQQIDPVSLTPQSIIANRYEILGLIGEGGMGAVYKARDLELDRLVAFKVVRPELAGHPEVLQRFKQEIILARSVSHRNIIRIFDLGVSGGMKFITMDFIEGQSLKAMILRGKFAPVAAVDIIRQICLGLDAAHAENVVHRDLKPQNVMVDGQGRAFVMDFGLAHSVESAGLTQTGVMLGTPDYMSPEQAKGERADHRSDLFAVGVIFYEMLAGRLPYQGDSVLGKLLARTQGTFQPLDQMDPAVPKYLSAIVSKCLAVEPAARYQTAAEIVRDLENQGTKTETLPASVFPADGGARDASSGKRRNLLLGGLLGAVVLAGAGFGISVWSRRAPEGASAQKPVTVLVADFANDAADPLFTGTLEAAFSLAIEGARFVNTSDRTAARRTGAELRPGATTLDESLARLVALREGVNVVIGGRISNENGQYRIRARALDTVTGKTLAEQNVIAAGKESVLSAVTKLALPIRTALGDTTPPSAQLSALETVTAGSLDAAQEYSRGQDAHQAGRTEEAIAHYQKAIQLDPNLGRAYAGLAVSNINAGNSARAEEYFQLAVAKMDRMTERERYRTRGTYYIMRGNYEKATQELSELLARYPADSAGLGNLAVAFCYHRDMTRAQAEGQRAAAMFPRDVVKRSNAAMFAMYAGDSDGAMRDAAAALKMNPSYAKDYIVLGVSKLAKDLPDEAAAEYERLRNLNARGASLAAMAQADMELYQGRAREAAAVLAPAVEADFTAGLKGTAARKLVLMAEARMVDDGKAAQAALQRALQTSRQEGVLFSAARMLVDLDEQRARTIAADLGNMFLPEPQSYGKLIESEIFLKHSNARDALRSAEQAKGLADTWIAHFDIGRAYLAAGQFVEASSEFELCLRRKGETAALFLDEIPTMRFLAPVYYYLGRAQEGLGSAAAKESFAAYIALKSKGGQDLLLADAKRRASTR